MGTITYDGVRFALYINEHEPPHVHGRYAGVEVIIDLYEDRVQLSRRKRNVIPTMRSCRTSLMYSTKQPSTDSNSLPSGEPIVLHPDVGNTLEEIEAALVRAAEEPEEANILSVVYRPEPALDLFLFTLSDGRRLSVPRENLQALVGSTPETAADFEVEPFGTSVWWTTLDEGVTLDGLLEGRYGNEEWMQVLRRTEPIAA